MINQLAAMGFLPYIPQASFAAVLNGLMLAPDTTPPTSTDERIMSLAFKIIIVLALAAVGAVLLFGLGNLIKGGTSNRSQQLMRWRIVLQAIAIVVVMAAVWFTSQS